MSAIRTAVARHCSRNRFRGNFLFSNLKSAIRVNDDRERSNQIGHGNISLSTKYIDTVSVSRIHLREKEYKIDCIKSLYSSE